MSIFSGIGDFLSGGLLGLGSSKDPSTSLMDIADPLNIAHTSSSQRAANQQFAMEYDIAKKNYEESKAQNEWNRSFQEQQLQYQKDLNALQMEREDTAAQRRVADLKASGLSPTLAAGSAADTGALHAGSVSPVAPAQMGTPGDSRVQAAMFKEGLLKDQIALAATLMGNFADVSKTRAETELIKAQTDQVTTMTPVELALKSQLLEFNEQINPHKIKQAVNTIDLQEKEKAIKDFDLVLAQDDHAMKAYQMAKTQLESDLIRANIDVASREYLLKGLAINMAEMENKNYAHAMEWFDERYSGAPVGFPIPNWTNALSNSVYNIATQATKGLEDFVGRNVAQARKAAFHARDVMSSPDRYKKSGLHSNNSRSRYKK